MPNVDHSQAVEAAKYIDNCFGLSMLPKHCEHVWDIHSICTRCGVRLAWSQLCIMARYILSAPPPAPPGDPVTAEKCREFVGRLANTAWHEFRHGEGYLSASELLRFEDELLAMFAGGTGEGDDGEPMKPQPIGHCPMCKAPIYERGGFCGVCRPGKL